jgi:hypothetical protein
MDPRQWDITQWPSLDQVQALAAQKGPVGWEQMSPMMDAVNPMGLFGLGVKGIGKGVRSINPLQDNLSRIENQMTDLAQQNSNIGRALDEFTKNINGSGKYDQFGGYEITDDDILKSFQERMFKKEPVMLKDSKNGKVFEVSRPESALEMYKFMQAQRADIEKKFGDLALEQYRLRNMLKDAD